MCEQLYEYFRYQCQHPGTPKRTFKRCELARQLYAWGTCGEISSSDLEPPTLISMPCALCKAAGGWQDYYDLQGRLRWRRELGAIQPPSKKA